MLDTKLKKIGVFILIAIMIATSVPLNGHSVSAKASTDFSGHWAESTLTEWMNQGFISGYEDGTVRPDADITRAEWMHIINSLFRFQSGSDAGFSDVPDNAWYKKDVAFALEAGYITGYSDGTIRPNQPVSRQEAAVMLSQLGHLSEDSSKVGKFIDEMPAWSQGSIGAVIAAGWMQGYPDQTFGPREFLSRSEAVVILDRSKEGIRLANTPVTEEQSEEQPVTDYDIAGTFGPEEGEQTIQGDVTIGKAGVILQNSRITGDVTITSSVGAGEVTLQGVKVLGELHINGGGKNSIYLRDTSVDSLSVNKKDGQIRIVASGEASIRQTTLYSGALLEVHELTGDGFESVSLSNQVPNDHSVVLAGHFKDVLVNASKIDVNLTSGRIDTVEVGKIVKELVVDLDEGTRVGFAIVRGDAVFIGKGIVEAYDKKNRDDDDDDSVQPAPNVTKLVYDPTAITLNELGAMKTVSLTALFSNGISRDISDEAVWSTGDEKIAVVSRGTVTATGEGSTMIHATYGSFRISIPLVVEVEDVIEQPESTVIGINPDSEVLVLNGLNSTTSVMLTARLSDGMEENVTSAAEWTSSNESIASVHQGVVTARGEGSTSISASYKGFTVTIPVTVSVPVEAIPAYSVQSSVYDLNTTFTAGSKISVIFNVYQSDGSKDTNFTGYREVLVSDYSEAPDGSIGSMEGVALEADSTSVSLYFAQGTATADLRLHLAAAQNLRFAVEGIVNGETNLITAIEAADPSQLIILTQPSSTVDEGAMLTTQPVLTIMDAFGNRTKASSAVTASILSGTSTLTGTMTVPAVNGIATFTDLGLSGASENVRLAFSAVNLTEAISEPIHVIGPFFKGTGTQEDPYIIMTADQLNNVRDHMSSYFALGNDIDLSNVSWKPIGTSENEFTGVFDGSGHTISNLSIQGNNQNNLGLFGAIGSSSTIQNVKIQNANIQSGYFNIGALVGYMNRGSKVMASSVEGSGTVSGYYYTGGLVGRIMSEASVTQSYANIKVSGTFSTGGLSGVNEGTIARSYALSEVSSNGSTVGGLIGMSVGSITDSYSLAEITGGTDKVGGLVGELAGTLVNSYASGTINSLATNIGGLVGQGSSYTIANGYFNIDQDGLTDNYFGVKLSDSQMKSQSSFNDWDFTDVWNIDSDLNNGYPSLR